MRNAAVFTPVAGVSTPVNLIYNDGSYEIINVSPFVLTINGIGGGAIVEPGAKVLYRNVSGGNNIQIVPAYNYSLLADGSLQTIDDPPFTVAPHFLPVGYDLLIIVNEYHQDEVQASAYPTEISALSFPSVPNQVFRSTKITGVTSTSTTLLSVAAGRFSQASNNTQNAYLIGFDFYGGARSSIMNHVVTLSNVLASTSSTAYNMFFVASSTTSGGPNLQVRFPVPIVNRGPRFAISIAIDTLDSTLTYIINAYGFYQ